MRVPSGMGFDEVDELCARVGDWEVVGPEGEYYGVYKKKPDEKNLPPYAMIMEARKGAGTVQFENGQPVMKV